MIDQCRLCGGQVKEVLTLGDMAYTGRFPKPGEEVPHGELGLALCVGKCGLVQLTNSFDRSQMYGSTYGYRSGLNQAMADHLLALGVSLQFIRPLTPEDVVLDIGSSDGTLLGYMPKWVEKIGVDPSAQKFSHLYPEGVDLIVDFFPTITLDLKLQGRKAAIISTIAMFYDLEDPLAFVQSIVDRLAPDGIWHTEQSYLSSMLRFNAFDTICHEHIEYYSLKQMDYIATQAGLKVINFYLNDINGGSFGVTFAHKDSAYPESSEFTRRLAIERTLMLDDPQLYASFKETIDWQGKILKAELSKLDGLWGFGASTKGNVLLQYYGIGTETLQAIYDINPDKEGCVTPGTNIPITCGHEGAKNYLVLPWHFRESILNNWSRFPGKFVFPLPRVEVIGG